MSRKVLAIASGGGHWIELCRILPIFDGLDVAFVSVHPSYAKTVENHRYYTVSDVSRRNWWVILVLLPQIFKILIEERPRVVITTGSAPALIALVMAKFILRSRTIWIDSIANVEKVSTSGSMARYVADVWLTQWPELQTPNGPYYWGAVM